MQLKLRDSVYKPREDSHLLQSQVQKLAKGKRVLDMGTGSGIQALTAAISGAKEVWACDINPMAIALTDENAKKNNVEIKTFLSDLFSAIHPDEKFDLIIFNAPYLEPAKPIDIQWSGGAKLLLKFLDQAKKHLTKNGKILFVFSSLTKFRTPFSVVADQTMPDGEQLFIGIATL
jgi:release factor glutamine methyltransferase